MFYCPNKSVELKASPTVQATVLEVKGLYASYVTQSSYVLEDINFTLKRGSHTLLLGVNGAGKSTLLKTIAGLLNCTKGGIKIADQALSAKGGPIAYLSQRASLDWDFPVTLERLILSGAYVRGSLLHRVSPADRLKTQAILELLELKDLSKRLIKELSGGQQQRALLGRVLLQDAAIFLLDEPLNAVDEKTATLISEVLSDLRAQGKTVLTATHHAERFATSIDQTLLLHKGSLTRTS